MRRVPVIVYLSNGVPVPYEADIELHEPRNSDEQASIRVTFVTGPPSGAAAVGIGLDDILIAAESIVP